MDRRAALALRQAYRRDAALLLQSALLSAFRGGSRSVPDASNGTKDAQDVLQLNTTAAASPFVPPPPDGTVAIEKSGGITASNSLTIDLAGMGRNMVLRSSREVPPPPPPKGQRSPTGAGSACDDGQLRPEYLCAPCGQLFFPTNTAIHEATISGGVSCGGDGNDALMTTIRVRSISRGRTRRRRAARVRSRQAAQEGMHRKDRGGGRQWGVNSKSAGGCQASRAGDGGSATAKAGGGHGHAVATLTQADADRRRANDLLYNVRDGTKHHCVVYTCGQCGHKTKLGGIDVSARERRRRGHVHVQDRREGKDPGRAGGGRKKGVEQKLNGNANASNTAQSNQKKAEKDTVGGDFISLAPLSPGRPSKQKSASTTKKAPYSFQDKASQSKKAAAISRLDQLPNRKRKKKGGSGEGTGGTGGGGQKNKKSKLLDFLSSLNG